MQTFTLSADADTSAMTWEPGVGTIDVEGTFGSGTLTLKFKREGGSSYKSLGPATVFTAAGVANFELHMPGTLIATLAGATGPSLSIAIDRKRGVQAISN